MTSSPTIRYFVASFIYGTIGYFLHLINARSEFVVLCRGILGSIFILLVLKYNKRKINKEAIKNNLKVLIISGISLGLNWLFLFEGYKHSVSISSLCNYIAPIVVVVITSIFLKERINFKQFLCVLASFIGIILVSGIISGNDNVDSTSIICGLLAATCFVSLVLCNKKLKNIDALEKTLVQLSISAFTVFPYVLYNGSIPSSLDIKSIMIILLLGFFHTGVAYILYFGSLSELTPIKIAVIGYVEPVVSVISGALLLHEAMTTYTIVGGSLIILSALMCELLSNKKEL